MSRPVPRPGVLEIDAYVPGKAGAPGAGRVFKLSANESPLGPSPRAVQAPQQARQQRAEHRRESRRLFMKIRNQSRSSWYS